MQFELDTLYTFEDRRAQMTSEGKSAVWRLIDAQALKEGEWLALNPAGARERLPQLPYNWDWQWTVNNGAYRGTFPKRAAAFWRKDCGLKCPQSFIAQLGDVARLHTPEFRTYFFRFVAEFDWQDGDYGDEGSCFWGDRSGARSLMQENGFRAVQFVSERGNGYARAWMKQMGAKWILFNAYGLTLTKMAQVLAGFWGVAYKNIRLRNSDNTTGLLYINGGQGVLLGNRSTIAPFNTIDFGMVNVGQCSECGQSLDVNDFMQTVGNTLYCRDCFHERYIVCQSCDEIADREDSVSIENEGYVCESCYNYGDYTSCEFCGSSWHSHRIQEKPDGHYRCEYCRNR